MSPWTPQTIDSHQNPKQATSPHTFQALETKGTTASKTKKEKLTSSVSSVSIDFINSVERKGQYVAQQIKQKQTTNELRRYFALLLMIYN